MRERSPLLRFLLICLFVSATLIPVISSQQQRSSGVARSPDTEFEGSGNPLNPDDEDGDVIEGSADEVEGSGLPPVVTSTASGKPSSAATSTSTSTSSTTTGGTRPSATNATKQIIVTATSTTPKSTTTEQRKQTVAVDEGRELVFGNAEDDEEEDDDDEDDYDDDDEEDEDDDDAAPTPPFNIREQPLPTATMPPLEPETTTTTTTTSKATAPPVFSTRRPAMTAPPPFVPSVNDEDSAGDPFQFMLKPGVLAAITGGAVVGVLLAILLVMFIVYRIRKKDEGSYSVDENNATPHYSYAYQKAATKEFYA